MQYLLPGGDKKVKCPKCSYTAESSLVGRHLEGAHGGVPCKECKLVLESRDEWVENQTMHTPHITIMCYDLITFSLHIILLIYSYIVIILNKLMCQKRASMLFFQWWYVSCNWGEHFCWPVFFLDISHGELSPIWLLSLLQYGIQSKIPPPCALLQVFCCKAEKAGGVQGEGVGQGTCPIQGSQ